MSSEVRRDPLADEDDFRLEAQAAAGRGAWGAAVFWSFLVLVSLSWNMVEIRRGALEIACDHARAAVAQQAGPSTAGEDVRIHATSLGMGALAAPPVSWEARALQPLGRGTAESVGIEREHGAECVRRIRPVVFDTAWTIDAPGLAQAGQPPRVVSSAVPTAPLEAVEEKLLLVAVVSHVTLWVAGLGGVAALARRARGASRNHGGPPGVPAANAAPGGRR